MKVLIIGASGRVGQETIKAAAEAGHEVLAFVRSPEKVEGLPAVAVQGDISAPVEKLVEVFQETKPEAIIFTAGSRGKALLEVDLYGAIKAIDAAEKAGIKRFIMLSSVKSLSPDEWDIPALAPLRNYIIAKHVADRWLERSTLDWTIAQPGPLHEDADTDLPRGLAIGEGKGGAIRISAVGKGLVALLDAPGSVHQAVEFTAGEQSVEDALAPLR
ncbi:MAG: SDR family oxidoreductase [Corynebacterium sp.]|nr:SDR family oxidoreductase [Corynebacterium sp.]